MNPEWWSLSQWIKDWQYVMWFAPKPKPAHYEIGKEISLEG